MRAPTARTVGRPGVVHAETAATQRGEDSTRYAWRCLPCGDTSPGYATSAEAAHLAAIHDQLWHTVTATAASAGFALLDPDLSRRVTSLPAAGGPT